ncbi:glycoside hydrolase family 88 protein [Rhizobium sp. SSA_523]|uniref:glycoside hydrolase family 88/105 protein n=1 Tax=Rhizobium sp. SSA_523 TaxID=2952477 RepID=UPI002090AEBD|nr:glycoside hydrolase family 88 protein [Rhizobium sp. SSA_523]MCO5731433.1 glycoside hydrolase family 88 protein [Rhizobium sp. SSA_523]WKC22045.1 glycoside hydrolase family 88 protein [Rhizobium sp. SSA_523]
MTMTSLTAYFDAYARDYCYYKGGSWCYEDGCLYRGLIALYEASGDERWYAHLRRLVDGQVSADGTLSGYHLTEYNIDNILPGRALVYLARKTGESRYRSGAEMLAKQLGSHPRIAAGPHWHKLRYPHQVWLDGLYMALPFKAEYAAMASQPALSNEAVREMLTALNLTFDADSGLYRHGYDEERLQSWANPQSGLSPAHWGRSIGWLAMAMVDLVDLLPPGPDRDDLSARSSALLQRLAALRTSDGRWLQVTDQPALAGNYAESSASAMFAYAFLKAARIGVPDGSASIGLAALDSLQALALAPDASGRPVLQQICCVAGLGGFDGVYRDGTPGYYLSESLRDDDIKGVGPLMMATAERIAARRHADIPNGAVA